MFTRGAAARWTRPVCSDHDRLCERRRAEPRPDRRPIVLRSKRTSPFWTRVTTGGSPAARARAKLGFRIDAQPETGAKRRQPRSAIGCTGALPPPRNESAGTASALRPSSDRNDAASCSARADNSRQRHGHHRPERDSLHGSIGIARQNERGLEGGQRHLVEAQGAHQGVAFDLADRLGWSRP